MTPDGPAALTLRMDEVDVPATMLESWQVTVNLLSQIARVPASLIMRVHPQDIEVLVASHSEGNPYQIGDRDHLGSGLYCETVMRTRERLWVANALNDPQWAHSPDIGRNMICYCGLPLTWPNGEIFGTICILDSREQVFSPLTLEVLERFRISVLYNLQYLYEAHHAQRRVQMAQVARQRSEDSLSNFNRDFEAFLDQTTDFIYFKDINSRFRFCSRTLAEITGHADWHEMIGKHDFDVFPPDTAKIYSEEEAPVLKEGKPLLNKVNPYYDAQGAQRFVQTNKWPLFDGQGQVVGIFGISRDVTDRVKAEEELRIAARAFDTQEGLMITDARGVITRVNEALVDCTGYSAQELVGQHSRMLQSGHHDKAFFRGMWETLLATNHWQGEIWNRRKSGDSYPASATIQGVRNAEGVTTHFVCTQVDITERKRSEGEIRSLAFYDTLTGLPNRRLLTDRFMQALAVSARSRLHGAVLILDMDHFKVLNDTMGHDYGDLLLTEVAHRVQACVRDSDTVARMGGDEFLVLLAEVGANVEDSLKHVAGVAENIRDRLGKPYMLPSTEYTCTPSIGAVLYQGDGVAVSTLLKQAELAMYQAKESGRNTVRFFNPQMQQAVEERADLERDLRAALARGELQMYYQVQVDANQSPIGAEGLIRWLHPKRGLISPAEFIPLAEESNLIIDIGNWVIDSACAQLARWAASPHTQHLTLAVNTSAKQFRASELVPFIQHAVRRHGIAAEKLKIELTESVVLQNVADVVEKMRALRGSSVHLSLDDFGTGYSSLSYLKQLPLNQLKIDQGFVRDITADSNDAVLVKSIIDLAQNFGLDVIAEGVETEAQLRMLRTLGCRQYQGYLFGKPVPVEQFEESLTGPVV